MTAWLLPLPARVSDLLYTRQLQPAPLLLAFTRGSRMLLVHSRKSSFSKQTLGTLRAETRPHGSQGRDQATRLILFTEWAQ